MIPHWLYQEVEEYFKHPITITPRTILDIGANIGAFALRAHREWPEAEIYCYEPLPSNIALFKQHVAATWCQIYPFAVRAEPGMQIFYLGDAFVTGGFMQGERQTKETLEVECVAAASLPACELVKIDTEGCEVEIVQHLNLTKTQVLMLEHHSIADAEILKQCLAAEFHLVQDESSQPVGTLVFIRKPAA